MRDKLARAAVTANPRMLLQASRTLKRDGRAGLWPTRPSNSGMPSSRLRYPLNAPDNTLLAHRPRQLAAWLMFTEPRYQRPAGGVVGFGAMPVVGDPPPPLVVRAGGL